MYIENMNSTISLSTFSLPYTALPAESKSKAEAVLKTILLVVNSASDIVGLLVNASLIYVIILKQNTRHSQRVVQSLIANLALLSILEMVVKYLNTGNEISLINVPGPLCSVVSFLRSLVHCSFLMNIVVIIYERLWSFRRSNKRQFVRTTQLILFVWLAAAIFSVPTALMKTGESNTTSENVTVSDLDSSAVKSKPGRKCRSQHLFGLWEATVFYETLRFLMMHVGVGIYMLYAVMEIRSRLRYLISHSNIPKKRLERKMQSIRLIYFYMLSFVVVALPMGILIFYRRVAVRLLTSSDSNIVTKTFEASEIVLLPALMFYIYMSPLLSWLFLSGFDFPYAILCSFSQIRETSENCEHMEDSLIATCPLSSEVNVAHTTVVLKENDTEENIIQKAEANECAANLLIPGMCKMTRQETSV